MAVARPTAARIGAEGEAPREVSGPVRLGRKTKLLVKRLNRGDIALIDHKDLDRVSAEDLIAAGVGAVLNCRPSSTGAYPNMGPLLLVQAGVHLVDMPGDALFKELDDHDEITVRGGEVLKRGKVVAKGSVQEPEEVRALNEERRLEIGDALEAFARNTIEHMLEERELLAGKLELPVFHTDFRDRPALVVVRGVDHRKDLRALRPYIRDVRPGAGRRRRRRERAARGGLHARHDRRRHGLGAGGDAALRRRARRPRLPRRARARAASTSKSSACPTSSSPRRAPARTWRC
jgi:uncharacterized membrane-anchored protein